MVLLNKWQGWTALWSHYVSGKCFLTTSGWNFHDKTLDNKRKKAWQFDLKFYMVQSIQVEGQKTDRNWPYAAEKCPALENTEQTGVN